MSIAIFGYGSLLDKDSIEKTLGIPVCDEQFGFATLRGFTRSWSLFHHLDCYPENKRALFPSHKKYAVYLDVVPEKGAVISGSLIMVSRDQLCHLDQREMNYYKLEVSKHLQDGIFSVDECYLYVGHKAYQTARVEHDDCIIVKEYVDLVHRQLSDQSLFEECPPLPEEVEVMSLPDFLQLAGQAS